VDDVLHLAKIYYCQNEWVRAEKLLEASSVLATVECRVLAAQVAVRNKSLNCQMKLEKWNRVLEILQDDNCSKKVVGNGLKVFFHVKCRYTLWCSISEALRIHT
jgi:hypothetical protein